MRSPGKEEWPFSPVKLDGSTYLMKAASIIPDAIYATLAFAVRWDVVQGARGLFMSRASTSPFTPAQGPVMTFLAGTDRNLDGWYVGRPDLFNPFDIDIEGGGTQIELDFEAAPSGPMQISRSYPAFVHYLFSVNSATGHYTLARNGGPIFIGGATAFDEEGGVPYTGVIEFSQADWWSIGRFTPTGAGTQVSFGYVWFAAGDTTDYYQTDPSLFWPYTDFGDGTRGGTLPMPQIFFGGRQKADSLDGVGGLGWNQGYNQGTAGDFDAYGTFTDVE